MQKVTVSLAPGQSIVFFSLLVVVSIGGVVLFYRRCLGELSKGMFVLLLSLRILSVTLLVLFIFRPVVSVERTLKEKPVLVFVIDKSGSMSVRDGANVPRRIEIVQRALPERIEALRKYYDVQLYAFSAGARLIRLKQLRKLKADGEVTDLARGVAGAIKAHLKSSLYSVILISDGADNSGREPVREIRKHGVRVFTVGIGSKLEEQKDFKDISITNVETQRYVTVNNITEIRVLVDAVGYGNTLARIMMRDEKGKEVASSTLRLDTQRGSQVAVLRYTPTELGQFKYTAEVELQSDERIEENNVHPFSLIVTKPRIRVLYVEGLPRWEGKFLLRTLQFDPNVEVLYLVRTRQGTVLQRGKIEGIKLSGFPDDYEVLKKFNVIIVGDLDRTFFTTSQLESIKKWTKEGGGFLMLGGYSSFGPGGYGGTPIEEILPVMLGDRKAGQVKDEFLPVLTAEGQTHILLSGTQEFFPTTKRPAMRTLPKLLGCTVVLGAKPGATVLMENPKRRTSLGEPLIILAVQSYGEGRTAAFTADTTWRWYFETRALGRESPYVRFWGQLIRWLASQEVKEKEEKPGITAFLDKQYYEPGEVVKFYARVRDQNGRPTNIAQTEAAVVDAKKKLTNVQLAYVPGTTGQYEADFIPPSPGKYYIIFTARQDGVLLGHERRLSFRVGKPNLEFEELDLDDSLLSRIAEETGGRYYYFTVGLDDLLNSLKRELRERTVIEKYDFFDTRYLPYFFILFVGAVSIEWYVRKRRQLS